MSELIGKSIEAEKANKKLDISAQNEQNVNQSAGKKGRKRASEMSPSSQVPSKQKRERIPVHLQTRFAYQGKYDPTRMYRLANEENVYKNLKGGYRLENGETEDQLEGTASFTKLGSLATQDAGGGKTAYWMSIEKEEWIKDQRDKAKEADERDRVMGKKALQEIDPNGMQQQKYTGSFDIKQGLKREIIDKDHIKGSF